MAIMRIRFFGRKGKIRRSPGPKMKIFADNLLNALTRLHSRETFRAAALGCTIPFCAARMTNGSATRERRLRLRPYGQNCAFGCGATD
jgi:hypothetical protein